MDYLPVAWRLRDQLALIVGGGEIALRKARLLARAGARLRVVSPEVEAELDALAVQSGGEVIVARYIAEHLHGVTLAIGATDDMSVNQQLHQDALHVGVPVNVVDNPPLCTFIFPAIVDRDPLLISISSGGASPVLARWARSKIETLLPTRLGELASLMGRFRKPLAAKLPQIGARRLFWEGLLDGALMETVLAGRTADAEQLLQAAVDDADVETLSRGEVYLVGAGPGDPDLMTFRALRLLQKADVVLYDRLVGAGILELARRDADLVYVGKARDQHVVPQEDINNLLVHYARQGKKVCRLKGGDPFIFGRGGEELDSVVEAGIPFQVVPGVTAAAGCAAYAGIPLTHRDHAQSVRFVTGHRKDKSVDLPWASLITPGETLVFYMGLVSLSQICQGLLGAGMDPNMPAAMVSRGTLADQQVLMGSLTTLPDIIAKAEVAAPSLLIIGTVVTLHPRYRWFG
ncbi:MAG: uroporphyrinogen-III C-methyltransferase [Gammaproteobacteria bacterium HGW-Gammaproteobacteria-14]|nr:MAG: uroporphyrinogen-III C-methyltransferase [Gammaproteobacteria bacterium HGW-Gammaproteobacteria-14]